MAAVSAVVVTVSDRVSAGQAVDESGPAAVARLEQYGFAETTVVTSTPDLTLTLNSHPDPVETEDGLLGPVVLLELRTRTTGAPELGDLLIAGPASLLLSAIGTLRTFNG